MMIYGIVVKMEDTSIDVVSITEDNKILEYTRYNSWKEAEEKYTSNLDKNILWLGYSMDEKSTNFRYYINQQILKYEKYLSSVHMTIKSFDVYTKQNNKINLKYSLDYVIESGNFTTEEVISHNNSIKSKFIKQNEIYFVDWYKKFN